MKKKYLSLLVCMVISSTYAQFIPEHSSNEGIYSFLNELACEGIIELNSVVQPLSKTFIANKLSEASVSKGSLNKRQLRELQFYLKTYRPDTDTLTELRWADRTNIFRKSWHLATSHNPLGLIYKDEGFTMVARPIYGISYHQNKNGDVTHTRGGLETYATIRQWGIYASLRDNHQNELLAKPSYFTLAEGGAFKENNGGRPGGDYSEMRGGITYAWKWGDVGLVKDHFTWGNNNHGSNIFSGRTPSFAHLRLHLFPVHWLEFNYIHGWLVSEIVDSTRLYRIGAVTREEYRQKFLAANLLTVSPWKKLKISLGNSIVYSDLGGPHPAYFIPFAFYKSIDHTLNHDIDNQNSQMFIDISSRLIRKTHMYLSVFVDEFSITRLKSKKSHNFISWKGGTEIANFPFNNVKWVAEFTQTTPITYKHYIPATTFESNRYNLGHYLRDNSREFYLSLSYRPLSGLMTQISYTSAFHGNEYDYVQSSGIADLPMLTDYSWKAEIIEIMTIYRLATNSNIYFSYKISDVTGNDIDDKTAKDYLDQFTPVFFQGKTNTLSFGFNIGF